MDAVGRRPVRARRGRGELRHLDSGTDMRKPEEVLIGMNTELNINSALFYCVNCFTVNQVYNCFICIEYHYKMLLIPHEIE